MQTSNLKTIVRGTYDIQKLRIQMGNRIVGNFKAKLGQDPGESEDEIDSDGKEILATLRASFKKITDGIKTFPRQSTFKGNEVIGDYTELCLIAEYVDLENHENQHFRRLGNILNDYPVWTQFLEGVRGVGPAMGGIIISEIDITKAKYPSSLWKYAGLDVAQDGRGRSRKTEHLVDCEYVTKDGEIKTRKGITFNPFLKTKLIGVLASSFLRAGDGPYSKIYNDYKNRLENHAVYGVHNDTDRKDAIKATGKAYAPKLHRHNMALRYMIKQFLVDLHREWRTVEGLPVSAPYCEAKLALKHAV